eukprot:Gb_01146 [translate_table: standard]
MASPTAMLAEAYVNMKRYAAAEDKEKNDSECSWVKTLKKKVFRQSKVSPSDRHSVQAGISAICEICGTIMNRCGRAGRKVIEPASSVMASLFFREKMAAGSCGRLRGNAADLRPFYENTPNLWTTFRTSAMNSIEIWISLRLQIRTVTTHPSPWSKTPLMGRVCKVMSTLRQSRILSRVKGIQT